MVAAHDVGKIINEQTIKGQVYDGAIMGLGYALSEEYKSHEGRNLNPNFLDFKIFTASDVDFPVETIFIETDDKKGPFGAKGIGEPGLVATAPAIANAIYDALGIRIRNLPITPEKIIGEMRKAKRKV